MTKWLFRHAKCLEPHVWLRVKRALRKVCLCARAVGVVCTPPVTFMAVATFWTRNCQKKLRNAQDHQWNRDSGELDNNWDIALHKFRCAGLCVTQALSKLLLISPFFVLPSMRVPFLPSIGPKMKSSTRLGFLSRLRMEMTRNTSSSWDSTILNVVGLLDPMCLFALSASSLECEVLLCLVLVECWQAHLLMIYNQVVDTAVLLVYWKLLLSWKANFQNDFGGCKVHHNWFQSWRSHPPVQPCANWDARYTASFCHRSSIEVYLPRFSTPLFASMAFWWSCCPGLRPLFFPLEMITEAR